MGLNNVLGITMDCILFWILVYFDDDLDDYTFDDDIIVINIKLDSMWFSC